MIKRKLSRREFMQAMMAGGVVTAAGLWMPGEKLISIPGQKIITGIDFSYNPSTSVITCLKLGPDNRPTIFDLFKFVSKHCPQVMQSAFLQRQDADVILDRAKVSNPEFIRAGNGSLTQGNETWIGVRTPDLRHLGHEGQYLINGQPAVHPGRVDQLVQANEETKIQVRSAPGTDGVERRFKQIYARRGENVVWPEILR